MRKMWLNFDGAFMRNKIILVFILIGFGLFVMHHYITLIPFEKEVWQKAVSIDDNIRPKMARDLISRKILIGKSREEVREILGKPAYNERENKISYILEEKYWTIDPVSIEWLDITFGQENKVEKAEIRFEKIG